MSIYRYSDQSIERLSRKAAQWSTISLTLTGIAGFGIFAAQGGGREMIFVVTMMALFFACLLWWQSRSARRKASEMLRATEVELTETELNVRHPMCPVTIRRDEVQRLRYLSDGILVQTGSLARMATIGRELDGFDDLAQRIELWAPADVPRIKSSGSGRQCMMALFLANIVLLVGAFSAKAPLIAVPCCIIESLFLIGCVIWVWLSDLPRKTKLSMLMTALPLMSLVRYAYLLIAANQ